MPSLKDLKDRISSVKSTQKITKAKKMVAASKLRRAQEAAENARPYAEQMEKVLSALGKAVIGTPGAPKLLGGTGSDQVQLVIVATSERGLCGAFNTNIAKAARLHIEQLLAEGKSVKILCIGKKGHTLLKAQFSDKIIDLIDLSNVRKIGFANAQTIATQVLDMFDRVEFDVASMFYSKFQSALAQVPQRQQLIPAPITANDNDGSGDDLGGAAYEYEPGEEEILTDLLPRNIAVQVYRALLENVASEQGASMTAMDAATRNAGDMIDQLTLVYNRTRQAAITKELIEIISGAEAL